MQRGWIIERCFAGSHWRRRLLSVVIDAVLKGPEIMTSLARRGCIAKARAVQEPARVAAAGLLAAEIAGSERQIDQQAAANSVCATL